MLNKPSILVFCAFSVLICRLVVPNKGYSSLDQSPDEKPLVALDTDRYVRRKLFKADMKKSDFFLDL